MVAHIWRECLSLSEHHYFVEHVTANARLIAWCELYFICRAMTTYYYDRKLDFRRPAAIRRCLYRHNFIGRNRRLKPASARIFIAIVIMIGYYSSPSTACLTFRPLSRPRLRFNVGLNSAQAGERLFAILLRLTPSEQFTFNAPIRYEVIRRSNLHFIL